MSSIKYSTVQGMNDVLPSESPLWLHIERTIHTVFQNFGFSLMITPVLEKAELFTRSVGDVTDIVEKQMYVFKDKGGDLLALRPEGTAPIVRSYIEHHLDHKNPFQKIYYWGPMYRHERPQKGRYRQFYQFGAEVFGTPSPRVDAEVIFMFTHVLKTLGIDSFQVQINSLGCLKCRPSYRENLISFLKKNKKELCDDCQRRLEKNPLRVLDCKNELCKKLTQKAPDILKFLCEECSTHFEALQDSLKLLNVSFGVNPHIVRGLDYYVKTAFEVISSELGAQNTIGAGGRYDGLVKTLGGPDIPAFGFAAGIERICLLIKREFHRDMIDVFFAALGPKAQSMVFPWVQEFRVKNFHVDMDYDDSPLKQQMKKADKCNARFVVIIGDQELEKKEVILRNMNTKEQKMLSMGDIEKVLKEELSS